jgi:hypothetical protein
MNYHCGLLVVNPIGTMFNVGYHCHGRQVRKLIIHSQILHLHLGHPIINVCLKAQKK